MPKKITATTPYGQFSRKTDRTYTHVILVAGHHEANIRRNYAEGQKHDQKCVAEYAAVVASGQVPAQYAGQSWCTIEKYQQWLADYTQKVETYEERLAAELAANAATIEAKQLKPITWAGRPDLAEKAAATQRKTWYHVEIYPVDAAE